MAEAVGLALGVVSVAGLFSTCIECFDIVVAGKDFSEDYEQLCALVSRMLLECSWNCFYSNHSSALCSKAPFLSLGAIGGLDSDPIKQPASLLQ